MNGLAILVTALVITDGNWDYPNTTGQSGHMISGEKRVSASLSKHSEDSFITVLDWYAKRTGFEDLSEDARKYLNRKPDDSQFVCGNSNAVSIESSSVLHAEATYHFTPHHMHALIVFSDEPTGDVISISVAGDNESTTITFIRRKVATSSN